MKILPPMIDVLHAGCNTIGIFDKNPEFWHHFAMKKADSVEKINMILNVVKEGFYLEDKCLEVRIGNMVLKNPIGLSAGLLKQSHGLKLFEALGFGYLTIGGITKNEQKGNQVPRMFRFGTDIVNGMGLPGDGVENEVKRLEMRKQENMMPGVPLIANLCNSADTKTEDKTDEFLYLIEKLYPYVDAFEINVSCPNQSGVTSLQQEIILKNLLSKVQQANKNNAYRHGIDRKMIFVKIAPLTQYENIPEKIKDLTHKGLSIIANVCNELKIDGITATNTSQEHSYMTKIKKPDGGIIAGGLSGLSLHAHSLKTIQTLRSQLNVSIPILGVGGIGYDRGKSALETLSTGADAIEILSSFVQYSVSNVYYMKKSILEVRKK